MNIRSRMNWFPCVSVSILWGLGLSLGLGGWPWIVVMGLAIGIGLVFWRWAKSLNKEHPNWWGVMVAVMLIAGITWGRVHAVPRPGEGSERPVGEPSTVTIRGVIHRVGEPDRDRGHVWFEMEMDAQRTGLAPWTWCAPRPVRLQVWAEDAEVEVGQLVQVSGVWVYWQDRRRGQAEAREYFQVKPSRSDQGFEALDEGHWPGTLSSWFQDQRHRLVARIWKYLPPSSGPSLWASSGIQAGFLEGLLVGQDRALPVAERERFRRTGTMHVMAVSGFNVSVVIASLFFLLRVFRMRLEWAAFVSLLAVWGLVGITGGAPSVLRAAWMATAVLAGTILDRPLHSFNAMAFAFLVMTWWEPRQILDVGFQLSFLATLGIIVGIAWCRRRFPGSSWRLPLAVTLSAQVAVFPLLWFQFGRGSWVSFPLNVVLSPLIPAATVVGAVMVTLGDLMYGLGQWVGGSAWVLLTVIVQLVRWADEVPYANVPLPPIPGWLVMAWYAAAGAWAWRWWRMADDQDHLDRGGVPEPLWMPWGMMEKK